MSTLNQKHNRLVWFDIPVIDLQRAADFYRSVLNIKVEVQNFGDVHFGVLEHEEGNGGCLVPNPEEAGAPGGILVYLNVNGRIRSALNSVKSAGGQVIQDTHSLGPHGFRALIKDSEGNTLALHSELDS